MEDKNLNILSWKLYEQALSYSTTGKTYLAVRLLQDIIDQTDDAALRARCYLRLGQLAERERQYGDALDYYEHGLALPQTEKFTTYFLNNNAAYCLNLMARHQEAEALCRKAIETDSSKYNAWKNLGMSLEAQGEFLGAAWAYVEAAKMQPKDTRAYVLLERLLADHSELSSRFPGILSEKAACLEAITAAFQPQPSSVPAQIICRLKYVRGKGYLEEKDDIETPISGEEIMQSYTITALNVLDDHPNIWIEIRTEDGIVSARPKINFKESSDTVRPFVILSGNPKHRTKHFHNPNCRRCRAPLENQKVAAGLPGRWICKTPGCPKGNAAFPKTSPWA